MLSNRIISLLVFDAHVFRLNMSSQVTLKHCCIITELTSYGFTNMLGLNTLGILSLFDFRLSI